MPKPIASSPFTIAALLCLIVGSVGFLYGLTNANLSLSEKGFYATLLAFGLYAAIAVQKNIRDKLDGIPVTTAFIWISNAAVSLALILLAAGLINAELALSEKGFYSMSFILALFSAVSLQKQVRDDARESRSTPHSND